MSRGCTCWISPGRRRSFATAARPRARLPAALRRRAGEVPTAQGVPLRAAPSGPSWPATTSSSCRAGGAAAGGAGRGRPDAGRLRGPPRARAARWRASARAPFALGRAGLLDGRRCTTHHDLQDELARRYPAATGGPRHALRRRRPGGHLGRHRQRHRPGAAPAWRPGTARRRRAGRPRRWSCTPGATATNSRPARCCGTASHLSDAVHRVAGPDRRPVHRTAAAGRAGRRRRGQRAHADPAVRAGHRADPAALPADCCGWSGPST